jgi:outer membrane protein assembly factor BamB
MSEDRELLERAEGHFQPPEGAFLSLTRRRARQERNRRLASAGLALALAVAATWVAVHGFFGVGQVHQPKPGSEPDRQLGLDTVSQLRVTWTAEIGPVNSSPVVADGRVYFGSSEGELYAFPVGCQTGGKSCSPLWIGHTSGLQSGTPLVSGGTVYIGSNDGQLYAFPTSCGSDGGTCEPRWTVATGTSLGHGHTSPVVVGATVYVATDKLWAIDAATGTVRWSVPIEPAASSLMTLASAPVVWGDTLVMSDANGVAAFSLTCGENGGSCSPLWVAHPPSVKYQPVIVDGVVYQSAGTSVFAYPVSCGTGGATCEPSWSGRGPGTLSGPPTVAGGVVYVGSEDGSLSAFAVGCGSGGSVCRPAARHSGVLCECFNSSIVVAGGVLYVITDEVVAYPESCAMESTCRPLFLAGPYYGNAGAAITDDAVYVATNSLGAHLYAFELPGVSSAETTGASGGVASAALAILVYGLLAALVARATLGRFRRRRLA